MHLVVIGNPSKKLGFPNTSKNTSKGWQHIVLVSLTVSFLPLYCMFLPILKDYFYDNYMTIYICGKKN